MTGDPPRSTDSTRAPTVEVIDSRRLTGPNIHTRSPGAIIELRLGAGAKVEQFIARWRAAIGHGLATLGWTAQLHVRRFEDLEGRCGVELMCSAAVDRLYAATELNEWAVAQAELERGAEGAGCQVSEHASGAEAVGSDAALERLAAVAASEQDDRRGVLELIAAAEARGVPWLLDDAEFSLGYFGGSVSWPLARLPGPASVEWSQLRAGPVALITGTNGKTTTTRLLARIASKQGLRVGNTSTDGLYVHERLVETGDWTGPGGARAVLRNPEINLALLESARGGLLRRGAGVHGCRVAVITNVARDHLGEYGVFDLQAMAAAKGIVATIADPDGRIVLGADCAAVVAWSRGRELPAPIVWFSTDADNETLRRALAGGGEVWTVVDRQIVRLQGDGSWPLCRIEELPLSFGGAARHNIANALAAAAAARGLGIADEAIIAALQEFGAKPQDNPGRARMWTRSREGSERVSLLLDFAHNLAGLQAMAELVRGLGKPAQLCVGMAGDRSDADLRTIGAALTRFEPRRVILREQQAYLRGRERGVVPPLLEQGLRDAGYTGEIIHAADEVSSLEAALAGANPDELIVLLVHTEREQVGAWLSRHGWTTS
ncbi:Cyanophycin synthase [Enhygromyxa salina]|uniref:Cyanophycin synthase n=1 Tax=Enhygromyxa salina TaxID=215803 RepID=A0A0C1ZLW0_9BACT|nr:Mur ligase family protein [Enhygromyxa salina]KIG11798.1 Cyanophycin synthase [Enhygromyxa salina]